MDISDEKLNTLITEHRKTLQEKEKLLRQCVAAKEQAELDAAMIESRLLQFEELQRLRGLAQTDEDHPHKIQYDGEWWALEEIVLNLRTETVSTSRRLLGSEERPHRADCMTLNHDTGVSVAAASLIGWIKARMYPNPTEKGDTVAKGYPDFLDSLPSKNQEILK